MPVILISTIRVELRDAAGRYEIIRAPVAGIAGKHGQPIPPILLIQYNLKPQRTWALVRGSEMTLLPYYHLKT